MKLSLNQILIGLVVILVGIVGWQYNITTNLRKENRRTTSNFDELQKKYNGDVAYLRLTQDEFKEYMDHKLDSVINEIGVKYKRINNVTTINNHYRDTTVVSVPSKQINDTTLLFSDNTGCISVDYEVYIHEDSISSTIIDKEFTDVIYYIQYKERQKYKFLGLWEWKLFGRKVDKIKFISECGNISAERIDIVK